MIQDAAASGINNQSATYRQRGVQRRAVLLRPLYSGPAGPRNRFLKPELTPPIYQSLKSAFSQTVMAVTLPFRAERNRIDLILF